MARPLTRAQQLQNAAFLKLLRRDGNARAAARAVGVSHGTIQHRRAAHPAFAARWDAAVVSAHARLHDKGGRKGPEARGPTPDAAAEGSADGATAAAHRTAGGEPVVVRRRDGKLQLRAAQPGKLTVQCEQAFLAALSATANVRMSAAAAGASVAAFYRRRRRNPAFAREMRMALEQGYERLEMALLESREPASHADDAWRHNDPPAIPPMTANQALQLMYLHQKEARLWAEPPHMRRRPGESRAACSERLTLMGEARLERDRERYRVAEAARAARDRRCAHEPPAPALPDLAQVTGWSKADPAKVAHDPNTALFGGWRLGDLEKRGRKPRGPSRE